MLPNTKVASRLSLHTFLSTRRGLVNTGLSVQKAGAIVLMVMLGAGCGPSTTTASPGSLSPTITPQPEIVAMVNGQPITRDQFDRELARWNAGRASLGLGEADGAAMQEVLDLMIEQELIRQTAANQGVVASEEEVNGAINQMVQESGQEAFDSWLSANFYTPEEFRKLVELQLISTKLTTPIADSVPTTADHAHARHILVNTEAEANEVLTRLYAGEDFAALAAEYSVDVTSKTNGGDLGWFPRGGLVIPEVEDAIFSMQPGQTSGVIATSCCGYDIVQTLEFAPREVDADTRLRLVQQAIDTWSLGLRNGADIQQTITFNQ
jgi:parvulin-like peptidyl-prolyl isomerase